MRLSRPFSCPKAISVALLSTVLMAFGVSAGPATAQPVPDLVEERWGETRAYFDHWLAVCGPEGPACRAVTYAGEVGFVGDYQLYLRSPVRGADYALTFVPIAEMAEVGGSITLQVDNGPVETFAWGADDGWYREGNVINEFTFGTSRVNLDLLDRMKAGNGLTLTFTTEGGERRSVYFSLIGVTDSLAWMDAQR